MMYEEKERCGLFWDTPAMLFDREKALQALDQDLELLNTLVKVWLHEYPQRFFFLQRALQKEDIQGLLEQAHSLKNGAALLGFLPLYELAKNVEERCKEGILGDGVALMHIHTQTYIQVHMAYKSHLSK